MKKSIIKGKSSKLKNPYDRFAYKTERSAVAILMHWMRNIIKEKNIELGSPDVDTTGADRKSPDTVIYESPRSKNVICVIEAKKPQFSVYDQDELIEPARKKANRRKAKYFATTNFKTLIWFDTEKANKQVPEEEQIINTYDLCNIEDLNEIEQARYSEPIKRRLEEFLTKLHAIHIGKEEKPKISVDVLLVLRLHEKIRVLSQYYTDIIYNQYHKDSSIRRKVRKWFSTQNWIFTNQSDDFDKIARQTAYLLINKILFYDLLQAKRPNELDPLEIPEGLTKGSMLQNTLQGYFEEILKIDYETIYTTDFIDDIAFPDSKEIVDEIKDLITILREYNFSKLGYDIIGGIFERLIPKDERHNLGQYFTRSDVVDLILRFCLHHEDDKVLDPSCGAGTFLKRAYHIKKLMNARKSHEDILKNTWGNDIAKFPATLATINLAICDLSVEENYPNIIQKDFFALRVGGEGLDLEMWRKQRAETLNKDIREIIYPRCFNVIVGNPPYTRQEEIPEIGVEKEKLIKNALYFDGKPLAKISKRAGIHAYFFIHGTKFLHDGGYFGFIVSNSWLDVDYGKGLQKFFLENYKIIAIIESKVERWFEEADINTCIIILQKCKNKKERDINLSRFVYLKKPLSYFIPLAEDSWNEELKRRDAIEKLKKTILAHNIFYENEDLRIFPISQKDLWNEGFDTEKNSYVGAKWGKYIRAPEIFFKILEKGKGKLVPLKEVADVRRGFTTGANEFFYLTEKEIKRRKIEKEFWMHKDKNGKLVPNKVIVSPREGKNVVIDPEKLTKIVLIIDKEKNKLKGKKILSYIRKGEKSDFNKRPTCQSRKLWYNLEYKQPYPILYPMIHHDRQSVFLNKYNIQVDHNLFEIKPVRKIDTLKILCFLLSTVSMLIKEFSGRVSLGEGALKTEGIDVERLLVPSKFFKVASNRINEFVKNYTNAQIKPIFYDLQANDSNEVSLEKIKPDRHELDKIIMGDILGLTDDEQLEVYKAVIDLVKSRIEKARSVKKKKKMDGVDIEGLSYSITERIKKED